MKLSDKLVSQLTLPDGKDDVIYWNDSPNKLGYRLRRNGDVVRRSWVVRYRIGNLQRRMTLDAVLNVEQATAAATKILAKVVLGGDPQGDKHAQRIGDKHTFRALADEYIADRETEVRAKTMRDTKSYLTGPYFAPLHNMSIERVTRRELAACLVAIKRKNGPIVASLARAKLAALLTWSMRMGFIESNPMLGVEQPKRPPSRTRVLSINELVSVWRACRDDDHGKIVKLVILTGARRQEIGGMRWGEFSADGASWTLPVERSKNGHQLVLPIMPAMRSIIDSTPRMAARDFLFGARGPNGYNSWGEGKKVLDARVTLTAPWQVRDLRRSVASGMGDLGIAPHIVETILNHYDGHRRGVAGVYNRSVYEREVRAALALWHRTLVDGAARKIVQFSVT